MKKHYEAPTVEKIAFNYRDQVVAASAGGEESSRYQEAMEVFKNSTFLQETYRTFENYWNWLKDLFN